jgi:hypothetical protein
MVPRCLPGAVWPAGRAKRPGAGESFPPCAGHQCSRWRPSGFRRPESAAGQRARRAESGSGRPDGHAGRGGLPHEFNLRRGQAVGLIHGVAERALQAQGFDGAGAGGRAEKLESGKQKAEIARRRAWHRAAASCRGYALRLAAVKRSPARTSVPQKHDILTNRPRSEVHIIID